MEKRKYTLRKRAESQAETRARIVEATMALHEELGPRNTTISAVAERAGVQRLTVYRHFPDEAALFQACTTDWLALNPPPPVPEGADDDEAREAALLDLYAYYRRTARMWTVSHRDVDLVPALQGPMQAFLDYLAAYAEALLPAGPRRGRDEGRKPAASAEARAAAMLAVRFTTWRSLDEASLPDRSKARLMANCIRVAEAMPRGAR